ncbi:MAG: hypothetical protein NT140_05585 [Deltaproteobacteria bacterium]|nr:hypothetical protein [Deltaproteobacteria bacterium]
MIRKRKYKSYPALFVSEQRENEKYDAPEKSTQHSKRAKGNDGLKFSAKARKTKKT